MPFDEQRFQAVARALNNLRNFKLTRRETICCAVLGDLVAIQEMSGIPVDVEERVRLSFAIADEVIRQNDVHEVPLVEAATE